LPQSYVSSFTIDPKEQSSKHEHKFFSERSRLYDKDLLDKYMKIKELTIEMATLEQMLTQKNAELTEYFGEVADKDRWVLDRRQQIPD